MNIKQAIDDILCFQKTHIDWAEFFEANPEKEREFISNGHWDDAIEHRNIVYQYDNVITCLKSLQPQQLPEYTI